MFQKNNKLEIKVPREFTSERPAVRFSHVSFDVKIDLHPLACRLPRTTGVVPSVQEGYTEFRGLTTPDDRLQSLSNYLKTDEPIIHLHVVSFLDCTLVSLILPHVVTDIMGVKALVKAWSEVLAGRPRPVLLGARQDPLKGAGIPSDKEAQWPHSLEHQQIKGFSLAVYVAQQMWSRLTKRNDPVRTIFLPAEFVAGLRKELEDETFLSDCDLVTAWMSRAIIASKGPSAAAIFGMFDLRSRLTELTSTAGLYVQNLILPFTISLPELGSSPPTLGYIAKRIRHCITEQATDIQARRLLRMTRETYASNGLMPFFGHPNALTIIHSNWTKGRFPEEADFSPAVIPAASAKGGGLPVSFWGTSSLDHKLQNLFIVLGKDTQKNYWLHACLNDKTWSHIQNQFGAFEDAIAGEKV